MFCHKKRRNRWEQGQQRHDTPCETKSAYENIKKHQQHKQKSLFQTLEVRPLFLGDDGSPPDYHLHTNMNIFMHIHVWNENHVNTLNNQRRQSEDCIWSVRPAAVRNLFHFYLIRHDATLLLSMHSLPWSDDDEDNTVSDSSVPGCVRPF